MGDEKIALNFAFDLFFFLSEVKGKTNHLTPAVSMAHLK